MFRPQIADDTTWLLTPRAMLDIVRKSAFYGWKDTVS